MADICPTVTADNTSEYARQMRINTSFAKRIHVDLMDGEFTPNKSPKVDEIWLPAGVISDVHLMFQKPHNYLEKLVKLSPHMVIIHAEAEVHHMLFAAELHKEGIKAGLAVLPRTSPAVFEQIMHSFDHILIFSGNLGYQGGSSADLSLLEKVKFVKQHHPDAEIGWDGGINDHNIRQIAESGVSVLNVGGYIHNSPDPEKAHRTLLEIINREV